MNKINIIAGYLYFYVFKKCLNNKLHSILITIFFRLINFFANISILINKFVG